MTDSQRHWQISRRLFLELGAASAAIVGGMSATQAAPAAADPKTSSTDDYLRAARGAAGWIAGARQSRAVGISWLPEPDHPEKSVTLGPDNTIYSGSAGTVLFLLELGRATGESSYFEEARRGADYLAASWTQLPDGRSPGFLPDRGLSFDQGLAGAAFALAQAGAVLRTAEHRAAALAATRRLANEAHVAGRGVEWVSSPAVGLGGGIVLYLLYASRTFGDSSLRDLASRAGERILERAERDPRGGLRWQGITWQANSSRAASIPSDAYFPNFELGTAGVAYVLARLYEETHHEPFLVAAREGARHIQAIATVSGDTALVHYREPDLTNLYYLGYCHGPAGTARLFYQLYKVTGEAQYLDWTERLARGVLVSGIPEKLTPGFWNVACQCCGSAAVTDFFLSLHVATGKPEYRAFALRVADQLISRAVDLDGKGPRWYQAWTRVKPWEVSAETGYKIGAAGIGAALLHTHLLTQNRYTALLFPDNPFPSIQGEA